jgi:alpha-methylacyl-CoA racemase
MEGTDVCFAPVLGVEEAPNHRHNAARQSFIDVDGVPQNAPAPRFSRTTTDAPKAPRRPGEDSESILQEAGLSKEEINRLRAAGVLT